jgi:hypothetical protein
MRKCVLALLVASSLAVATAAQAPGGGAPRPQPGAQGEQPRPAPPSTQGERPTAPAGAQVASKVSISGCIQNAPTASATPGGAAPAAGGAAAKFVLSNAKAATGAGAVGTAGSAVTATRYQLEGEEKTISPHVNHQVEITGTVQPAGAGAAAGAAAAGPMLKVESLKMIAAKCS